MPLKPKSLIPVLATNHKDKRTNIPTRELRGFVADDEAATARTLWIPAVNNHAAYGRWTFGEITDPWDAKNTIRQCFKFS